MEKVGIRENKRLLTLLLCCISTILTFIGLTIFSLVEVSQWVGVGVGGGIFVITGVIALTVRKSSYIVVTMVNSLALGITISSLYTYLGYFPPVWQTGLVTLGTAGLFGVFCLLTKTVFFETHPVLGGICFLSVIAILEILGAVFISPYVFGYALFLFMTLTGYVLALSCRTNDVYELFKNMAVASFTVLILAVLIVLAVLTEGDGADLAQLFVPDAAAPGKKKKISPYKFLHMDKLY